MSRLLPLVRASKVTMARRQFAENQAWLSSWPSNQESHHHCAKVQAPGLVIGEPISRFPVPDMQGLPLDMRDRIRVEHQKAGFVPNVFKALAYRPAEFRAFFAYYDALLRRESDTLTMPEKEMIVVATSAHNDCLYCVIAHGALHRLYSKNSYLSDQLTVDWESADINERERAILKFTLSLCKAEHIPDKKIEELRRHGLTDDDMWDVGAITSLFAVSNRMAHLTYVQPNAEFNVMGRLPTGKKEETESV